jgi:hypothetical protein
MNIVVSCSVRRHVYGDKMVKLELCGRTPYITKDADVFILVDPSAGLIFRYPLNLEGKDKQYLETKEPRFMATLKKYLKNRLKRFSHLFKGDC